MILTRSEKCHGTNGRWEEHCKGVLQRFGCPNPKKNSPVDLFGFSSFKRYQGTRVPLVMVLNHIQVKYPPIGSKVAMASI